MLRAAVAGGLRAIGGGVWDVSVELATRVKNEATYQYEQLSLKLSETKTTQQHLEEERAKREARVEALRRKVDNYRNTHPPKQQSHVNFFFRNENTEDQAIYSDFVERLKTLEQEVNGNLQACSQSMFSFIKQNEINTLNLELSVLKKLQRAKNLLELKTMANEQGPLTDSNLSAERINKLLTDIHRSDANSKKISFKNK